MSLSTFGKIAGLLGLAGGGFLAYSLYQYQQERNFRDSLNKMNSGTGVKGITCLPCQKANANAYQQQINANEAQRKFAVKQYAQSLNRPLGTITTFDVSTGTGMTASMTKEFNQMVLGKNAPNIYEMVDPITGKAK